MLSLSNAGARGKVSPAVRGYDAKALTATITSAKTSALLRGPERTTIHPLVIPSTLAIARSANATFSRPRSRIVDGSASAAPFPATSRLDVVDQNCTLSIRSCVSISAEGRAREDSK